MGVYSGGVHEGDDRADDPRAEERAADPAGPGESPEDAAWREIVANYGERVLGDDPAPDDSVVVSYPDVYTVDLDGRHGGDPDDLLDEDEFVPPDPDLPRPTPERLLAWLGVLGAPVVAIILVTIYTVTGFVVPSWIVAFLVLAFLGGFGYLLVTMSRDPGDPWDDGARL